MAKKASAEGNGGISGREEALQRLAPKIAEGGKILEALSKKYKLTPAEQAELISHAERYASVPVGVFSTTLAPLEAVVKFLRERYGLSIGEIASLLSRDHTTIWTTYHNVKDSTMEMPMTGAAVPLSLFASRKASLLESLCLHLSEAHHLRLKDIAELLNRDSRTIWTCLDRARRKRGQ